MTANYVLLEKITVGAAGASSVTFSSIPQTGYTDLVVKISSRSATDLDSMFIAFNGDSGANYNARVIRGNGSAASSLVNSAFGVSSGAVIGYTNGTTTTNTFNNAEIYIPNYTGSNQKSFSADNVEEANATTAWSVLSAGLWSGTAAITSIRLFQSTYSFAANSTFYLYGVAKLGTTPAIAPKATGGSIIETDGTYWYHAFLSSGTFTPTVGLSCDVLVVAGGGAGGGGQAGGGGAGGVIAFASQSLASGTGQTVTVGAGGAGVTRDARGSNGSNSQFASLTAAVGGGGGGSYAIPSGLSGGSGGGSGNRTGSDVGGGATSGQGFAGGSTTSYVSPYFGGGGGGAGAVGTTGTSGGNGNGGAGTNSVTNWGALSAALTTTGTGVSGFIAGGGGAGGDTTVAASGGSGGGGAGSLTDGVAGVANTGSGGQGTRYTAVYTSGAGGSGLVIVRYPV
jgi:hypothetical protein